MSERQRVAFEAAVAEGLSFFDVRTHVVPSWVSFVAQSWEDGGYTVGEDGLPVKDVNGNTVAESECEPLDAGNEYHVRQCEEWYYGE